jgi:hypothetical protein
VKHSVEIGGGAVAITRNAETGTMQLRVGSAGFVQVETAPFFAAEFFEALHVLWPEGLPPKDPQ